MALPVGVSTCLVTFGKAVSYLGAEAVISGRLTVDRPVVHAATGTRVISGNDALVTETGTLAFYVPHVDQSGFVDAASQGPTTNWTYVLNATITVGGVTENVRKVFQPLVGQTEIDLDLVAEGPVTPGVTAPQAVVTSVAGETGAVSAESLAGALEPALADSFARVVDGELIGPDGEPIEVGTANILLSDERPENPTVGLVRIGLPFEDPDPEPEPGTVILSDNFNRADAGELGAPQVGTAPTEVNVWIRDNAAAFPTGSSSATWAIGPADFTFEFKIVTPVTGGEVVVGNCAWRYTDDNNRFSLRQDGVVEKRVGGAYSNLGTISGGAFVLDDVIRIKAAGNVHTIYRNDVQVFTFTTADLPDGDVNIYGGSGNAPRIDYVEVTTP